MISLRQLRFFVALADELNFSRAAENCYVTQPTLSAGLKELEDMLGVQLAERTKRSVLLTPVGEEVARRAKSVLLATQEIEVLASQSRLPQEGDLKLGAIPTIGPFLLPKALRGIRRRFPKLNLYLREEMTEQLIDGLVGGRLDLILIAMPFEIGNLTKRVLFEDGYQLASPRGGRLSQLKRVTSRDLAGDRLMLLEGNNCLQRHAIAAFPDGILEQDRSFAATSLQTLVSMVSEGLGVTLLPDLAVDAGIAKGQSLSLTPLAGARARQVALVWRPTSPRQELFEALAEIVAGTRRQMMSSSKPDHLSASAST